MISVEARFGEPAQPCTGCDAPGVVMLVVFNRDKQQRMSHDALAAAVTDDDVQSAAEMAFDGPEPMHMCQACVDKVAAALWLFADHKPRKPARPRARK